MKEGALILQGYQLYHNYIIPHEALDGKTQAEASEITIEGKNKDLNQLSLPDHSATESRRLQNTDSH